MQQPKPRRRPLWHRIAGGLIYVAFCATVLMACAAWRWANQSTLVKQLVTQQIMNTPPEEVFENKDYLTILVLGCDVDLSYGGKKVLKQAARSDMMLVAKLDFAHRKVTGISIPRDLLVALPGYREQKINAYHVLGGNELSKRAAEQVLGISIDRVVEIDYEAFQEMVDLIGGVEVYIPKKLKYTDKAGGLFIDLKPGKQTLDGYDSMCFVRYRHGDSDFARQDRQKDFLLAFKDGVMKQPGKLPTVANKAMEVMGGELDAREVASLMLFARKVGNDNIKMGMVPTRDEANYNLSVDRSKLREKLKELNFTGTSRALSYNP